MVIGKRHGEVVGQVLKGISPSERERKQLEDAVRKILQAAENAAKIYGMKPMLCGSVAKDTWLSPPEIDLFMLFPESLPRKKLEEYGLQAAKEIFEKLGGKCRAAYSEHPYLTGLIKFDEKALEVDIVPAYETSATNIKSAVDRTPHHVNFVLKTLDYGKCRQDEVRLLKKFAAARGCYGADLAVQGFSGYLCELLIIKFETFLGVMEAASKWRAGVVINHVGKKMEREFRAEGEPLVVIDPVDPNRNVAASVSVETFYRFAKACGDFLENPGARFFEKDLVQPYSADEVEQIIAERGTRFYAIRFPSPELQPDVYHSQMRKALFRIGEIAKKEGFALIGKDYCAGRETIILLEAENWMLPKIMKRTGPSVFSRHAEDFLNHYHGRRIFIENGAWTAILERRHHLLLELLKELFSSDMAARGIPKNIAKAMEKCELASGDDFLRLAKRLPEDFRAFLRQYFEKDLNVAR